MATYLLGVIPWLLFVLSGCGGGYTGDNTASRIAEQEGPAVAFVVVEREGGKSQGSGIAIDGAQGHFLTNWHVIQGMRGRKGWVRVQGAEWMPIVALVAKDEHKDLAIVKADLGAQVIHEARLGSVTGIKPGDPVVAIGNPLGEEFSVTDGIVSQIRNQEGYKVVQTTAPISPGNSGGPLFNELGEVIGVVTFTKQDTARLAQNLNYAVAIDEAKPLLGKTDYEYKVVPGVAPPDYLSPSRLSVLSGSLRWVLLGIIIVGIYSFSTHVIFRSLIRNRDRSPNQAFGLSAVITFLGSALTIVFFLSGYLDYLLGWQTTYAKAFFWWSVIIFVIVLVITIFMTRTQRREN